MVGGGDIEEEEEGGTGELVVKEKGAIYGYCDDENTIHLKSRWSLNIWKPQALSSQVLFPVRSQVRVEK